MNEEELIQQLNKIKPKPAKDWKEGVMEYFDNFVTHDEIKRNSFLDVFYFLNLSNMSTKLKAIISIISIVATFGAGGGIIYASDSANPGDFLYGLDKTVENVQRSFTTDTVKRAELELAIMDERVLELKNLSTSEDAQSIKDCISEVEQQRLRIQDQLKEMDKLRTENKLQTQDQLKVMEQLQTKLMVHEETMDQVQTNLKSNGDSSNLDSLQQVQNKYSDETQNQIRNFEDEAGVQIQETENEQNQNQNDGDQNNQEQEQEQNQNQNTDTTNQQSGTPQNTQQQGKN